LIDSQLEDSLEGDSTTNKIERTVEISVGLTKQSQGWRKASQMGVLHGIMDRSAQILTQSCTAGAPDESYGL